MDQDSRDPWIRQVNEGDDEALGQLFLTYGPYLRIVVRRRLSRQLRSKVESKDVVQSVFAHLLQGFRNREWQFANRAQLRAFLGRVAWNRLADRYRKHRIALGKEQSLAAMLPAEHPCSTVPRPSEAAQGQELWLRVLRACSPEHQEIVRLRSQGLPLAEIAARTGLHEGSVRRILYDLARRLAISRRTSRPTHGEAPGQIHGQLS